MRGWVGVWVCGCVGVWVCGWVCVWVCGCVGVGVGVCVGVWDVGCGMQKNAGRGMRGVKVVRDVGYGCGVGVQDAGMWNAGCATCDVRYGPVLGLHALSWSGVCASARARVRLRVRTCVVAACVACSGSGRGLRWHGLGAHPLPRDVLEGRV